MSIVETSNAERFAVEVHKTGMAAPISLSRWFGEPLAPLQNRATGSCFAASPRSMRHRPLETPKSPARNLGYSRHRSLLPFSNSASPSDVGASTSDPLLGAPAFR